MNATPQFQNSNFLNYPFDAIELTEQINLIPNFWSDLADEGLFSPAKTFFQTTTTVELLFAQHRVVVLGEDERGSMGPKASEKKEDGVILKIPHIPFTAYVRPGDIQNRVVVDGGQARMMNEADATAERLLQIRQNHAQTLEYLRWGALKGKIKDGKGKTLYDLYKVFNLQRKTFDLKLGDPNSNINAICTAIRKYLKLNLKGETMKAIRCKVPSDMWDRFTSHPMVEKFYVQSTMAQQLLGAVDQEKFLHGGILWEPNYHAVTGVGGATLSFLDDGEGVLYPEGTTNTFLNYFGPADTVTGANRPGGEVYVSPKILDHGKGIELFSESNPLPVCARPDLTVSIISSN